MDWKEISDALKLPLAVNQHITKQHVLSELLVDTFVEAVKYNVPAAQRSTKTKICPFFDTELFYQKKSHP